MANPAVATANRARNGQQAQMLASIFSKYGIFLIFAAMVVAASILSPAFLSSTNLISSKSIEAGIMNMEELGKCRGARVIWQS